jgi:hypothetical protein
VAWHGMAGEQHGNSWAQHGRCELTLIVAEGKRSTIFKQKQKLKNITNIIKKNTVLPYFLYNTCQTKQNVLEVQCISLTLLHTHTAGSRSEPPLSLLLVLAFCQ